MCLALCRYQTLPKLPLLQGRGEKCLCRKINLITLGIFSCIEGFDCSIFSWCRHGNGPQAACTVVLGGELLFVHDCRWCFGVWAVGRGVGTGQLEEMLYLWVWGWELTITALTSTAGQVKTHFLTFLNVCHLEHRVFNLSVGWVIFLLAKWVVLSKGWEMLLVYWLKKMQKALFMYLYCCLL